MLAERSSRVGQRSISISDLLRSATAAIIVGLGLAAGVGVGVSVGAPAVGADATGPVRVALAVPIVVPGGTTGFVTASALEQYTSPFGLLTRQLDAIEGQQVTIGIDPMIIVSIRILGSSAPPSATAWLDRLAKLANPTFPLAYADADLTLASQAGGGVIPAPESFDFAIDPSLFAAVGSGTTPLPPPATATPTPTGQPPVSATPTPTGQPPVVVVPPLPTSANLASWPYAFTGIAWPMDNTVVRSDLGVLAASGYGNVILSSSNLDERQPGAVAEVDGTRILVSDAAVSTSLRTAAVSQGDEEWLASMAGLSQAVMAAGAAQSGHATVFATIDRSILSSSSRLGETIAALGADRAIRLVPISEVAGQSSTPSSIVDTPHDPMRVREVARMLAAEQQEKAFATVADDPSLITSERRLQLLALMSSGWAANEDGWPKVAAAFLEESVVLRESVQLVQSSSVTMVADFNQFFPITVRNDLDQPVTVFITARPATGLLVIGDSRVELHIDPGTQGKTDVPVRSLSNGIVQVEIGLTSAAGLPIGLPVSTELNVQAGWETPIVVVVAGGVIAIFAVGIIRTVLRRRRMADG